MIPILPRLRSNAQDRLTGKVAVPVLALASLICISCFITPQPRVVKTVVEKEVEVPVEVVKEVEVVVEKEVIREVEVPVEVIVEKEVIREVEVPVEVIVEKEVIKYIQVPANLPVSQVVRLVGLVPSQGSVVLDGVGDSATLSVRGYYSDQSLADLESEFITYESSDPSVVSVSPDGLVTANGTGSADIEIGFGEFSKRIHVPVIGDIPTLPPVDQDMVGPIPGLGEEVSAVLNRVIVELHPSHTYADAEEIAEEMAGRVVFSYGIFPGHVLEFNIQQQLDPLDVVTRLQKDRRVIAAYPDILFEALSHPIDTLSLEEDSRQAYISAGFEGAWRIMEKIPALNPVIIAVVELGGLNVAGHGPDSIINKEFDQNRIHSLASSTDTHAVNVTSVIAAVNHKHVPGGNDPPENFSGIVTSVEGLKYDIIALTRDEFLSLATFLQQMETIEVNSDAIDVVNMSFGDAYGILQKFTNVVNFWRNYEENIISRMQKVVVVAAAGNCGEDAAKVYPARLSLKRDNVITVGGATADYTGRWVSETSHCSQNSKRFPASSAHGPAIVIAAPSDRVSIVDGASGSKWKYSKVDGTSVAAPIVTGTVALLRAIDPAIAPAEVRELLVETGDEKTICTSNPTPPTACPPADEEEWSFLRADKAVAKLLSDRIKAEVADIVFVPPDTQRVSGEQYDFGVEILNTGEIVWPFYLEASVRGPSGIEQSLAPIEIAVAPHVPAQAHLARWGFSPVETGCWDLRVKVWIDSYPSYLRTVLEEIHQASGIGLIDDSGWIEEVLEVRSDSSQPEQCSGSGKTVPLVIEDDKPGAKANVLLLADTSGSMEGQKAAALKEAIEVFARRMSEIRLQTKGGIDQDPDRVGLIDFDDDYREVIPVDSIDPTDDGLNIWKDAVGSLNTDGGTALYDAIIRSIDVLEGHGVPNRKSVLIALTDGMDRDSRSSLTDAISRLEQSSITLFALALSEPGGRGEFDFTVLQDLADAAGGAAYPADTNNLSGLYELFATVFEIEP